MEISSTLSSVNSKPACKPLRATVHRIPLWNGEELHFHKRDARGDERRLRLAEYVPASYAGAKLEVEIGPGRGEFIARRAGEHSDRYFIGIDRRPDRTQLTTKKLNRTQQDNWMILNEDASTFVSEGLPQIEVLHLYQPDPWPKVRHHKHRFFRSPEARVWADAVVSGGQFRLSTDHLGYFQEMLDIIKTWGNYDLLMMLQKEHHHGAALTHFESIFLRHKEPVFKATFVKR